MVLVDADFKVIFAFRYEDWKDRCIRRHAAYSYPQSGLDPQAVSLEEFSGIFKASDVVHSLVKAMGFGGVYAEEICRIAGVRKDLEKPGPVEIHRLYDAMRSLVGRKPEPVLQDGVVYPFPISGAVEKRYPTMSEAIDDFYLQKERPANPRLEKLRRRLAEQEKALTGFERKTDEEKRKGDLVYSHFLEIEKGLRGRKGKIVLDLD
jgi:predicted ribosome quality control (RQC) complex YloA/Tae2 family protein